MNAIQANRIVGEISPEALVVDVGGGAMPFPRADYVIDAISWDDRSSLGQLDVGIEPRFSRRTWCRLDLCDHQPWPFKDRFFDFATCSHLLEDVRDPIWICSELCRIAKAGYIEVPSRVLEQSLGVEHPSYAGYYHHRWLIQKNGNVLEFRHKPHVLHMVRDAIVASVGIARKLNDEYTILHFQWTGQFDFMEVLEFSENKVIDELCQFAAGARSLPNLTVPTDHKLLDRIKRSIYFRRLRRGGR